MIKNKLRIAMFFSSDPSCAGGVQEQLFHLTNSLEKLGHEITVFGPSGSLFVFQNYIKTGKIIYVPIPNGNWANIQIGNDLDKLIKKINTDFDIFHLHEPYIPFVSWMVISKITIPIVASFHTGWNNNSSIKVISDILPKFRNYFSKYVSATIFISDLVKKCWSPLCDERVKEHVIIYGIDHKLFKPKIRRKDNKKVELLFLGRIVSRKGLHLLLEAMSLIKNKASDFRLTVIGDGRDKDRCEKLVHKFKLDKNVRFLGEILGEDRINFFQEADIFCAPYDDEGLGLTIIEAIACGCPIVGFWNEAFENTLDEYPAKYLFASQGEVKELSQALLEIINNRLLRNKLRLWCKQSANNYSWHDVAIKTEKIYLDLLK